MRRSTRQGRLGRTRQAFEGRSGRRSLDTYVGQGAVRFYLPLNVQLPNDFFAQAVVVTEGLEQRERVKASSRKRWRPIFRTPSVGSTLLELGPPVGSPLQYRVSGREPDEVRKIASRRG